MSNLGIEDGLYSVVVIGRNGPSLATWAIVNHRLYGFDNRMSHFDGALNHDGENGVLNITIKKPLNIPSPFFALSTDTVVSFELSLDIDSTNGKPFVVDCNGELLQVSITMIRTMGI